MYRTTPASQPLKFPTPTNTLMRLSHVLVVIAATFLLTSEALLATTDSNQVKISKVTSPGGPSQRMLRTHHNTYEDDEGNEDDEERALTKKKMKKKMKNKMTVDGYANKLSIAEQMEGFKTSLRGYSAFLETHKYGKLRTYINFLRDNTKK
ncbi:hypothetical protein BBO99_00009609 [Phytophthora kernoviae]|uniref:RxLR effector protein n=2 Tax=Phytophthora kernoviae TaxID=325452 RepID=A0A3R7GSD5_9STRA|nr:hypothetical protein G195_009049 [Phytophthora kernoviae 00238/432]RLN06318.1 hypothetical protein BBI17_009647 [Phytophthora kernoviae]RLN72986.1 hypothetical protein BBO99_00009609 [Phytophthora kernoviae]